MGKSDFKKCIKSLENQACFKFPLSIVSGKNLKPLAEALENRNPYAMGFRINLYAEKTSFKHLSKIGLIFKNKKDACEDDKKFIKEVCDYVKTGKVRYVFEGVGNFIQIAETLKALENIKKIQGLKKIDERRVKVAVLLWTYLALFESIFSIISQIFVYVAQAKNDQDYLKYFKEAEAKGEHLLPSKLRNYAEKWALSTKKSNYILTETDFRNGIAHANLYYDSRRNKLVVKGSNKMYKFSVLFKEFEKLFSFDAELLYNLNGNSFDIQKTLLEEAKRLKKQYYHMQRYSQKYRVFKEKKTLLPE